MGFGLLATNAWRLLKVKLMPNSVSVETVRIDDTSPPVEKFIELRVLCGWGDLPHEVAERALSNSIASLTARDENNQVVGFVRVIGDELYLYIQDMIVDPDMRDQKLGKRIMDYLLPRLRADYPHATIMLMCAKGRERFYAQFGFQVRPSTNYGPGMYLVSQN